MIKNICKLIMASTVIAALFMITALIVFHENQVDEPLIISLSEDNKLLPISFSELSKHRTIEVECQLEQASSKVTTIKGFSLLDFLSEKHMILSKSNSVVLMALSLDGYQAIIPQEMLEKQVAYIALECDGERLERPMLCFENGPAYKNVKDLIKIDILIGEEAKTATQGFLRIDLQENPTTGYVWQCDVLGDTGALREVLDIYSPTDTDNKTAGSGGIKRFLFEPYEAGKVELVFTLSRNWQKSSNDKVVKYCYSIDENKKITRIR